MFTFQRIITSLLLVLLIAPMSLLADTSLERVPLYSCVIDILKNTSTCDNHVRVPELGSGRVVGVARLCSAVEQYRISEAEFMIQMAPNARGWLFNIGDSASNNGWAGDWGTGTPSEPWVQGMPTTGQSRDAEVHINGDMRGGSHSWSAWGSDHTQNALDGHRRIFAEGGLNLSGKTVRVLARNEAVELEVVGSPSLSRVISSPYMFALNNQIDFQGPANCDLYFSANQVIDGAYRNGVGVEAVAITLYGTQPVNDSTIPVGVEDELAKLAAVSVRDTALSKTIALKLHPENSKRLSNLLLSRGIDPATINSSMIGTNSRSQQMALETLRAQELVMTSNPTTSSLRKALRRFQRRVKISVPNLNSPEIVAELLSAEKFGDIK
jgi:hypothetical protein